MISEGITSGVNCIRFSFRLSTLEKARAMVVFPTPGISSISTCPPARTAMRIFSTMSFFPITALVISAMMAADLFSIIFFPLTRISHNCSVSSQLRAKIQQKSPSAMVLRASRDFGHIHAKTPRGTVAPEHLINLPQSGGFGRCDAPRRKIPYSGRYLRSSGPGRCLRLFHP